MAKSVKTSSRNCVAIITTTVDVPIIKFKQPSITHITVKDQDSRWLHFRPNSMLSNCIENQLLSFDCNCKENDFSTVISDFMAKRFSGKSISKKLLPRKLYLLIHYVCHKKN